MNVFTSVFRPYVGAAAVAMLAAGCTGLGSMEKEIEALGLKASPEPLILRGGQVELEVTGKFPEKYFAKKVSLQATPVLTWNGGTADFTTARYQGESVAGNDEVVPFESGKSISYTASIPFDPAMEDVAELAVRVTGSKGSKSETFAPIAIGTGVITTPLLVQDDDRFIPSADAFVRTTTRTLEAVINFEVNKSVVRPAELKDADWVALQNFALLAARVDSLEIKSVVIEAFASPEGEITLNENLASERAAAANAVFGGIFTKAKVAAPAGTPALQPKGEDWEGFKQKMQASSIGDKNLILRVLEMYSDKNKREEEIRNMAKTYKEIAETILPELRRARIIVTYEIIGYSDEQLRSMAMTTPAKLTVEELLYAAKITDDMNSKLSIYQAVARQFPTDFRGFNNAGWALMQLGRPVQAKELFNQALAVKRDKAVLNNVGAMKRMDGDSDGAMKLLNEAAGAGPEVNYNKGLILIEKGDYPSAISNMGNAGTVNLALAKMLNGDLAGAQTVLGNAKTSTAIDSYIKAIAAARANDVEGTKRHLADAIAKDAKLRDKAKRDLEFRNVRAQLAL
jgi:Flp pilus assembly protein TadD/outer membrane protein OmpA-like peptidoglycan-associated protein